jgi:uncharacterized protein YecT (DUF1311 family)
MKGFATRFFLAAFGIFFAAAPVFAQDISDCERNALTPERCAAWQSAVQAESLSLTLRRLDAHIAALAASGRIAQEKAGAQREKLAASQTAWETFRDRHCALSGSHPAGTSACRQLMTEARLSELQDPDVPEAGEENKSWSERRVLQSSFHRNAWIMLRIAGPPMRTVSDRVALATGPRETQDWNFRKAVSDFQVKIRAVSGFGPLSSGFIAAEWDMLRYDPETGSRLHQAPETIEGSPADNNWDKNEAEAFAARLPACLKNLADPQCRVQYSTELGCRYDAEMAAVCQAKLDGLREVFQSYSLANPEHRDHVYKAVACLTPVPFDDRFSQSFLVTGIRQKAASETTRAEGKPCSELGLAPDGTGWSAKAVPVFGVTMDLEVR